MNSDFRVTVGSDEYPAPLFLMMISLRRLFLTTASASAPSPPPPSITTAGVDVYPEPGSVILI